MRTEAAPHTSPHPAPHPPPQRRRARIARIAGSAAALLAAALLLVAAVQGGAQGGARTSRDGVYTLAQANEGRDVFASACQSCHTPTVHAGPPFRAKWFGRTLGELFGYLRREMPKMEPGALPDEDYARLVAYLLRINGMPTGSEPLAADSTALHRIRLDSVSSAPTSNIRSRR